MRNRSKLTRADYENYLIYLYFGSNRDLLEASIHRAYRDFNRTMHGFRKLEKTRDVYTEAVVLMQDEFETLKTHLPTQSMTNEIFDGWHRVTCEKIVSLFEEYDFHLFVGQAQKWINMTFKYIFTAGEERIEGFSFSYPFCHVPIDNILLAQLEKHDFPALSCAWSRLDNYDEYLEIQKWFRENFTIAPMDVEFMLWLGQEVEP